MNFDRFEYLKMQGFEPKRILDIGAHIGTVAKQMKELWPETDILMVEANPLLEDTLKATGIPYKICLLGDDDAVKDYYMTRKWLGSSGNSVYKELTPDYEDQYLEVMKLQMHRLDDLLEGQEFDLIKIDTQGSEIDILRGGLNLVGKAKCIIIECSVMEYNKGGAMIHEVFKFMADNGLFMSDIVDLSYRENDLCQVDLLFKRL